MLANVRELLRYDVVATESEPRRLCDLYFDDRTWEVRALLVAGGEMQPDGVLQPPSEVREIDPDRRVLESGPTQIEAQAGLTGSTDLLGSHVQARDARVGRVSDLLVDTATWHIVYVVVDTWGARGLLLDPKHVAGIDGGRKIVRIDLDRAAVKHLPRWRPEQPPSAEDELRIANYWGVPPLY